MRITNSMLVSNYMNNMQRNLNNMSTVQNQLSSGKIISRPSENPYVAVRNMQLNNEISANKQYNTNITDTSNWLDTTDTALSQAVNIMSRIKELTVKAGNGSYSEDEFTAIKDEIVEKVKEFGQVLNTSFDGDYIFGGTKSNSKPINVDDDGNITYIDKNGNVLDANTDPDGTILSQIGAGLKTEISDGVVVQYNKTAVDVLNYTDSKGNKTEVQSTLSSLIKNLTVLSDKNADEADKKDALNIISEKLTDDITAVASHISQLRSNVGAMQNRMETAKTNNEDQTYNMTSILSETEDIDFAEKTMEYSILQTVYIATLQTSSKVLQNTLLDYV